jgi:hypothetical protein
VKILANDHFPTRAREPEREREPAPDPLSPVPLVQTFGEWVRSSFKLPSYQEQSINQNISLGSAWHPT